MTTLALLFLIGTLLLTAEIFLPGGIAGVAGAVVLLVGSVLAFNQYGLTGGVWASVGALGLLGVMLYVELVLLPKTKLGRSLVVNATVDSTSQPPIARAEDVVDQPAVALTTLAPSGFVQVAGRRFEAFCRSGYAAKGADLRVVGVDNFRLIVIVSNPISS
jgi:membrane-bound serine protease (ClpP class)